MKHILSLLACWFFGTILGYSQGAGSLGFDGIDDYVQVENVWMSGDFSVAVWFKSDKKFRNTAIERIMSFGPAVKLEIGIGVDSSFWVFDEALTFGTVPIPKRVVRDGKWHHAVFVKNAATRYIYLDGVELTNYNESQETRYYPLLRMGAWSGATNQNNYFHGLIDEVKIWGIGLSAVAVKTTMNTESLPDELMLQGYYNFNQDERDKVNPNVVSDRTKSSRKGFLVNFDLSNPEVKNWQTSNPPSVSSVTLPKASAMMVAQPIDPLPAAPAPVAAPVIVAAPKIELPTPEAATKFRGDVTVFDMNGRTVHQINDADLRTIDLSQFMNGMYYFTIKRGN